MHLLLLFVVLLLLFSRTFREGCGCLILVLAAALLFAALSGGGH
jgi:hypothetical protein